MTLLIAGHETTAAVLTWTFHCIADRPDVIARIREEVCGGSRATRIGCCRTPWGCGGATAARGGGGAF